MKSYIWNFKHFLSVKIYLKFPASQAKQAWMIINRIFPSNIYHIKFSSWIEMKMRMIMKRSLRKSKSFFTMKTKSCIKWWWNGSFWHDVYELSIQVKCLYSRDTLQFDCSSRCHVYSNSKPFTFWVKTISTWKANKLNDNELSLCV